MKTAAKCSFFGLSKPERGGARWGHKYFSTEKYL